MTARLAALRAQAAALRAWADTLDAQVAEAEARAATEHVWKRSALKYQTLGLPPPLHKRPAGRLEYVERCTRCDCLRTSSAPWLFRGRDLVWSSRKPPCSR